MVFCFSKTSYKKLELLNNVAAWDIYFQCKCSRFLKSIVRENRFYIQKTVAEITDFKQKKHWENRRIARIMSCVSFHIHQPTEYSTKNFPSVDYAAENVKCFEISCISIYAVCSCNHDFSSTDRIIERAFKKTNLKPISNLIGQWIKQPTTSTFISSDQL